MSFQADVPRAKNRTGIGANNFLIRSEVRKASIMMVMTQN